MIIINSVSSSRFSINGVQYLKNYISAVHGSRVEIFNSYERADVLLPLTLHSQVSLNGTIYGTAALLQAALLNVIYSRATLGLGGLEDQDNIDIKKTFKIVPGESFTSILNKINSLSAYTVTEKQSVWFVGREPIVLQDFGSIGNPFPVVVANPATVKYKMINKGKGTYGAGAIQLTSAHLELVYSGNTNPQEMENDAETDIINFSLTAGQTINQWLNARSPVLAIQPQDAGYTIFKGQNNIAQALSYLWLGSGGTYGAGQAQSTGADFQLLSEGVAVSTPNLQQVTNVGAITTHTIGIHTGNKKTRYTGAGTIHSEDGSNFLITETTETPVANVTGINVAHRQAYKKVDVISVENIEDIVFPATNAFYQVNNDTNFSTEPQLILYYNDGTATEPGELYTFPLARLNTLI